MTESPFISVIIPAKNAARTIRDCLESIHNSTYSHFEVIVVDGLSTDDTVKIAQSLGAKVIIGSGKGRAADNNIGIKEARGEIVAFTDSDCAVDRLWLERIARTFQEPGLGITGGPDLTLVDRCTSVGLVAGHIHSFIRLLASETGGDAVIGCNSAYLKKALVEAQGFDETLPGAEDTELHSRILSLGYNIRPDVQCIVYHYRKPDSFRGLVRRFWEYGCHMGIVHRRNRNAIRERNRHIYPIFAGFLLLVILFAFSSRFPFLLWVLAPLLTAYALFNFFLQLYLVKKTGHGSSFLVFLSASTLCMLFYLLGFAKEQFLPWKLQGKKPVIATTQDDVQI